MTLPATGELIAIGRIRTPYASIEQCPRHPWSQSAEATIEIDARYLPAMDGLREGDRVHVLWWAGRADRELLRRRPVEGAAPLGVFAGRGVARPNPLGLTLARIMSIAGRRIRVCGMDCTDGTALLDLKPAIALPDRYQQ